MFIKYIFYIHYTNKGIIHLSAYLNKLDQEEQNKCEISMLKEIKAQINSIKILPKYSFEAMVFHAWFNPKDEFFPRQMNKIS